MDRFQRYERRGHLEGTPKGLTRRSLASVSFVVAVGAALAVTSRAEAAFHLMRIREVLAQAAGDPRIQFVELEMEAAGQNLVGGHDLTFYDAQGNETGTFVMPDDVASGNNGDSILIGTEAFAQASDVAPDFILPDGLLHPFSGRVCFDGVDCVAYGDYTGANAGYGSPAPAFPVTGVLSLTLGRTASPRDNSTDYDLGAPTPRNNSGDEGGLVAEPDCYLTDDFADLSNWDVPVAGSGVDLTECGVPATADIGTIEVEGNLLRFLPGAEDQLDLGNPIAIAHMTNAAALQVIEEAPLESYRATFDVRAELGVVQAATFVRQHGLFDADTGALIPVGGGYGMNFSFGCHNEDTPEPCPDGTSHHFHADIRTPCFQEGTLVRGDRDDATFTAIETMEPETWYTIVMDVDGDDLVGPVTLRVKAFLAGEPEPPDYTISWQADPLPVPPDEILDRLFLVAALRAGDVPPGPALELRNLSFCEIPRNQQSVRFLECQRDGVGGVTVTWENPFGADAGDPIRVLLDGEEIDTLAGDEALYVLGDVPDEDFTLSVVNFSGVAASCTICKNDPPEAVIDAPDEVAYDGGSVAVDLDSSGSSDPDGGGELLRLWEVIDFPVGTVPIFDDPFAIAPRLTVDAEGEYVIRLTVTDAGCPGDDIPLSSEAFHTLQVGGGGAPGFVRGDCNGDEEPNLSDAVFHLEFLFTGGATPGCLEACDANGDGGSDVSDAISLLNFLFIGGEAPPDPGPKTCGPDPDPDGSLGCEVPQC